MAIVTDDDIFRETVIRILGGHMGPPKYLYRSMVRGMVLAVAKKSFNDPDLADEPKLVDYITDRVVESIRSTGIYEKGGLEHEPETASRQRIG